MTVSSSRNSGVSGPTSPVTTCRVRIAFIKFVDCFDFFGLFVFFLILECNCRDVVGGGFRELVDSEVRIIFDVRKIELQTQTFPVGQVRKGRQIVELSEPEIVQKGLGRAEHCGAPGNIAVADDPHPIAFKQLPNDIGTDRNAADFLDLAPRNRLTVGHQCKRLEQCA